MRHTGDVPEKKAVDMYVDQIKQVKQHGRVAVQYAAAGHEFGAVFQAYQDILAACNAVDYDDLQSFVSFPMPWPV